MIYKKIIKILTCATLVFGVIGFCGCSKVSETINTATSGAQETAYLSSLNAQMKEFYGALEGFKDHVKVMDVDAMKQNLDNCQAVIDSISKLDVPDSCKEVQNKYLEGLNSLQNSLSDYVKNYSDLKDGKIDNATLKKNVTSIQDKYNNGIDCLKAADEMASQINA